MANANTSEFIESLASDIGENIYIDIAKWHLYLADAHLHTAVAEQVYPLIEGDEVEENRVRDILQGIPVKLGGGKVELPLLSLLPATCESELMEILKEYQNKT